MALSGRHEVILVDIRPRDKPFRSAASTPGELRDALSRRGHTTSTAQLKWYMLAHGAFVRGDLWNVGRPVQR
ncbi:hypothetical protein ACFWDQ_20805 [Streptomyces sp. NPDC060053]|uniref:hypothetical protein n=1 Tax=Streptomyces sp. NPDC060053 TaxID=3347047 RepID=UPI0036BB566D